MSVSLDLHSVWHSFVMEKAGIVCRTGTQSSSSIAENTLMHSYLLMDAYKLEVPTENTLDVIEQGGSQRTWISCRVRLLGTAQPSAITPRPGCGSHAGTTMPSTALPSASRLSWKGLRTRGCSAHEACVRQRSAQLLTVSRCQLRTNSQHGH